MKIIHYVLGVAASIAIIIVLLVTSFEIGIYSDFNWYEKEYVKYGVLDDLEMEKEDAMQVTCEMMDYLRGDREDLVVDTAVNGKTREFFNDREKAHMADVQKLFLGGLNLRLGAIVVLAASGVALLLVKADWKRVLPKSFLAGAGGFILVSGIFAALIASDFNKYFVMFHEIFFDNDLWLLDPQTDLLIRMLPEGFFFDMVVRIGLLFVISLMILLCISAVLVWRQKNKNNL